MSDKAISIHLIEGGRRPKPVSNTSKPHKGKGKLAKQMKALHWRRLAGIQ